MNKFSSNNSNNFFPINTHRFTPVINHPIQRSNSIGIHELIQQFEKKPSVENELIDVKPEPISSEVKEEAKVELLKEEEQIVEPIVELTEIYSKDNEINIEHSIQKEIKLSHQGFKQPKMKLIVDEIVLNIRKKKMNGWST